MKQPAETCPGSPLPMDNVDPEEARRYAALASTWWDPRGPFWPLHRLNALRTHYLRNKLSRMFGREPDEHSPLKGLEVLDVGCGGGILSESMARLGARVHGIDVVERNIAIASGHAAGSELKVRYETCTVSSLAARELAYDVVLNMEVVEHVPDVKAFMADCARLTKPGGAMAVATINRTPRAWLFAIFGAEYVLRWLPRGTHQWRRFVTPSEVESLLSSAGLQTVQRTGVKVNPFNRKMSLTRSLAVNFMLLARRGPAGSGAAA